MKAEVSHAVGKYKPQAQVERKLFHGTDSSKLDAICKQGFDRDYSGTAAGQLKYRSGGYKLTNYIPEGLHKVTITWNRCNTDRHMTQ